MKQHRKSQSKAQQPSARAKLSAAFTEAFERDFAKHGVGVIEKMREKYPEKYAELAAKIISTVEPPVSGFESANSLQEIAAGLLKSVGCKENVMTDEMIEQTCKAHDLFVEQLQGIAAMGQMATDELQ
jgi:hypothetical protein